MKLIDCFNQIFAYTGYILQANKAELSSDVDIDQNFSKLIETAKSESKRGHFDEQLFEDALFPVCAWVDEKILLSSSSLSKIWVRHQLQRKYFNTANAGEEFFIRMNTLESEEMELRAVFAYCLSLGFCGKYFKEDDIHRIDEINRNNLRRLTDLDELEYPEQLFPNAYSSSKHRKSWSNRPGFITILLFILPPAIFITLYFIYDSMLATIFNNYL